MKKIVAVALMAGALAACTDAPSAIRAVEAVGLENVQTTGYRYFGCGKEYVYHTGFEATNVRGQKVSGVACSGWLIGTAVKFD